MSRVLYLAITLALAGCGGGESAPTATVASVATTTTAGPPLNPFEQTVIERLQVADPGAGRTEHGFRDAHALARIEGDRVRVDIPAPGYGGNGKVRRSVRYRGVRAQIVTQRYVATTWRFRCAIAGFGDREVNLTLVSEPRRTVPAVHRLLRCGRR